MISRCTQIFLVLLLSTLIAAPAQGAAKLTAGYSSISPAEWTLVTASKAKLFENNLDVATVYLGGRTGIVQVMIAGDIQIGQIGGSAALFGKAAGIAARVSVILSNAKDLGRDSSLRYATFRMTG
jgi:ABC-type nitrate/sulfonate/bicarbonate transport system substrate-binding protein